MIPLTNRSSVIYRCIDYYIPIPIRSSTDLYSSIHSLQTGLFPLWQPFRKDPQRVNEVMGFDLTLM